MPLTPDFIDHAENPPMGPLSSSGRNSNGGQEVQPTAAAPEDYRAQAKAYVAKQQKNQDNLAARLGSTKGF